MADASADLWLRLGSGAAAMSVAACAALVERGDPDRFLATMAAPARDRATLFVLYAFNLEVARAPWVSAEPMIGEMRLQFWRDTLQEARQGTPPRAHEVATPLAEILAGQGDIIPLLDSLVMARWADLERRSFDTPAALRRYLDDSAGGLMWASARALGTDPAGEAPARGVGRAQGLANWLLAQPDLAARGWRVDTPDLQSLIAEARSGLAAARSADFGSGLPAIRAAWRAAGILSRAARDPAAIAEGRLHEAEFKRRGGLILRAFTGRW